MSKRNYSRRARNDQATSSARAQNADSQASPQADPRRLGEILQCSVARLIGGDEARAFSLWRQVAGPQVVAATQPLRLARGTLTVTCESSVWANELTYLGGSLLQKLHALDPDCPVKKLRFVTGGGPRGQENEPSR